MSTMPSTRCAAGLTYDHCMGYTVVLSAEVFEAIDHIDKDNIHHDLQVGYLDTEMFDFL